MTPRARGSASSSTCAGSAVCNLGRFLEHSRVYLFERGETARCYMGSADLMPRNLDHRVEILAPIEDPHALTRVRHALETCLADTSAAWELQPDGAWLRVKAAADKARDAQRELMEDARRQVNAPLRSLH